MLEEKTPQEDGQVDTDSALGKEKDQPAGEGLEVETPPKEEDGGLQPGAEDEKGDDDKKPPAGAPEKYEDFKLPDGQIIKPETLEGFVPIAKELNLSQDQAQKLVDFQSGILAADLKAQEDAFTENRKAWLETARGDQEYGGAKFKENKAVATKAFQKFGSPELQKFFADAGLTSHPEVIRLFYRIGRLVGEDTHVPAAPGGGTKKKDGFIGTDLYGKKT